MSSCKYWTASQYYVDAVYCYRLSSIVCWSVCHSREPCKTAELIEMPFGLRTRVGPRNHVLDWVQIAHAKSSRGGSGPIRGEGVILRGAVHCKV